MKLLLTTFTLLVSFTLSAAGTVTIPSPMNVTTPDEQAKNIITLPAIPGVLNTTGAEPAIEAQGAGYLSENKFLNKSRLLSDSVIARGIASESAGIYKVQYNQGTTKPASKTNRSNNSDSSDSGN